MSFAVAARSARRRASKRHCILRHLRNGYASVAEPADFDGQEKVLSTRLSTQNPLQCLSVVQDVCKDYQRQPGY